MSHSSCTQPDGLRGVTTLVTGTSRGLGRELVDALLRRGADKVYAACRDAVPWPDKRVVTLRLNITDPAQVALAAITASNVTLVINNAGMNSNRPLLAHPIFPARR